LDPTTINQSIYLTSETLTHHEAIKIFEEELGTKFEVTYDVTADDCKRIGADVTLPYFQRMVHQVKLIYLADQDYEKTKKEYPNVKPLTVREYARSFKK